MLLLRAGLTPPIIETFSKFPTCDHISSPFFSSIANVWLSSKITNNLLNPDVASKADDICRLLIPINKVKFDYNNLIILNLLILYSLVLPFHYHLKFPQ